MNIWSKAILTGLAATAVSFILIIAIPKKKKVGLFAGPQDYYSARYHLKVEAEHKINGGLLDTAAEKVKRIMLTAGFKAKVTITDKHELDVSVNDILQSDTTLIDLLITGKSEVEIREMYQTKALEPAMKKMITAALKYMPAKNKTIAKPVKKIEASKVTDTTQLTEFEFPDDIDGVVAHNGYNPIDSLITFSIDGYPGGAKGNIRYPSEFGIVRKNDTMMLNRILRDTSVINALPYDNRFYYGFLSNRDQDQQNVLALYSIRTRGFEKANITNEDIASASVDTGPNNLSEVTLIFSREGSRKWERLTGENIDKPLPIIYNGLVVSAPYVESAITGGTASISGSFTVREAKMLASQLSGQTGKFIYTISEKKIHRQSMSNLSKILLRSLLIFVLGGSISYPIFKALKNS